MARLDSRGRDAKTACMARSMSWRLEGRLNVVVHGSRSPSNLEWQRYVVDVASAAFPSDTRVVVLSRGGSPDGYQRQSLIAALRDQPKPVALLTDNVVARTTIIAMRLFNPTMRAFSIGSLKEAGEFLGLSVDERERVAQLLFELQNELDESAPDHLPSDSAR